MRSNPLLDDPFVNCALFCQNNFYLTRDIGLEHLKPIHWKNEVNYNMKRDETEMKMQKLTKRYGTWIVQKRPKLATDCVYIVGDKMLSESNTNDS